MSAWGPLARRLSPSSQATYGNVNGAQATSYEFATLNPILPSFTIGFESDTGRIKIGDGVTDWNDLHYFRVDTVDDVIIDDAAKGLVLKDTNGHYWRITISTGGVLQYADLGTTKPAQ